MASELVAGPGAPQYMGPGAPPGPGPQFVPCGPGTPHSQNSFTPPAGQAPPHFSSPVHPGPATPYAASPAPSSGHSPFPTPPTSGGPPGVLGPSVFPPVSTPQPGPPHPSHFANGPMPPHHHHPAHNGPGPGPNFPPMGPHFGGPPGPPHGPGVPFSGPFPPHPGAPGPFGPQHMHGPIPMGPHGPMVPGPPMGHGPMPPDRMDSGRHMPYFNQPDYRIHELNKRLQQRTEESDSLWWDAFSNEFFEDDATMTLTFCLEDGPKRYTIGRTLIPRYFRSVFEGGVTELYYSLRHPKESFHNTSITLDCDQATIVSHHGKPQIAKVCSEGRLIVEFTFDDLMRIKSWHFATRGVKEMVPRSLVAMHAQQPDPGVVEQLGKNITRQGFTNVTLNYLRLCVILEPMQELMTRHKAYSLSPRDCLKTTLFQKWQRMVAPPETQRPASKRRKRKGSTAAAAAGGAAKKGRAPFSLAGQVSDVMVVGEPSLMGGEFGDEDERLITRLENSQFEGTGGPPGGPGGPGAPPSLDDTAYGASPLAPGGGWPTPGGDQRPPTGPPSASDLDKKPSPSISQ